jgi:hypothetical protein
VMIYLVSLAVIAHSVVISVVVALQDARAIVSLLESVPNIYLACLGCLF